MHRFASHQTAALLLISCALMSCAPPSPSVPKHLVATYSIVAHDPETRESGVAVQSKFFSVGSVVPWARAGVGAVATQASANIKFGREGLLLMEKGDSPDAALQGMLAKDEGSSRRQVCLVDSSGNVAAHTGRDCFAFAGHRLGKGYGVQGNLLAGPEVLEGMATAFEKARDSKQGHLADWLVLALQAGEDAGGDKRGRQSAALLVVREKGGYAGDNDRFVDLRVEDNPDPTKELQRLLKIHQTFFAERHVR